MGRTINCLIVILLVSSSIWIFQAEGETGGDNEPLDMIGDLDKIPSRAEDQEEDHTFTNITIRSDSELNGFIEEWNFTGSGTESDPYLIKDLEAGVTDHYIIPFIHLSNTTSHLIFENITIEERNYFEINTTKIRIADCKNVELRKIEIESRYGPSFEALRSGSLEISDFYSDLRYDDDHSDFTVSDVEDILLCNCTSRDGIIIDLTRNLTIRKPSYYSISISNSSEIKLVETTKDYASVYLTDCSEIFINDFSTQLIIARRSENITFDSCFLKYNTNFHDCRNLEFVNLSSSSYSTVQDSYNITVHDNDQIYFNFFRCGDIEIFNNSRDQTDYYSNVALSECSNASILNNFMYRITLSKSIDCLASDNKIFSNYPYGGSNVGIYLSATERSRIERNKLYNISTGIHIYSGSTGNVISDNLIDSALTGIYLMQNRDDVKNVIRNNIFANCSSSSITIGQLHRDRIYGNTMTGTGININYNLNNRVNVEISSNNTLNGKPILSILDTDMGGAVIEDDYSQYLLFNASNVIFRNITHENAFKGPVVHQSSNIGFENFDIEGSDDWGFLLTYSENVTISNCRINDTMNWPISSTYCDNLKIQDSSIENNRYQDTIITGGYFRMENCTFLTNGNITMNVRDSEMINNTFDITENRIFKILSSIYLTLYNNSFKGSGIQFDGILNGYQLFDIPMNNTLNGDPIMLIQDTDLHGLEINASGKGQIIFINATNARISNQVVDERGHYLSLMNSRNIKISNISMNGCKRPIRSFDSKDIFIENSSFNNGITLLYSFYDDENITFESCSVEEFNNGINIHYGYNFNNINISNNRFTNCSRPVKIFLAKSLSMQNNTIIGRRYVLEGPDPFERNVQNGMYLDQIIEGEISGNRVEGFHTGVYLGGEYTVVKNNRIAGNEEDGLYLNGQQSIVTDNEIVENHGNGINLYYQSGSIIEDNDCRSNDLAGIVLIRGGTNRIRNNDFSFSGIGIEVRYGTAYGNVLRENYIEGCSEAGIYIAESGQLLYDNTLVNCGFDVNWVRGYQYHGDPSKSKQIILIPSNNTVNGIPVFIDQHKRDIDVTGDYSQFFLFNVSGSIHDISMSIPVDAMKIMYCNDILLKNIEISGVKRGVYAEHCDFMQIENVSVSGSAMGMKFRYTHMNISGCRFEGNTIGITSSQHEDVYSGTGQRRDPTVQYTIFKNNEIGLEIYSGYSIFYVIDNEFRGNNIGLLDIGGSAITLNHFIENNGPAIFMQADSYVVKNYFEDNNPGGQSQVIDNRTYVNEKYGGVWYDNGVRIGNQWSDLTGPDNDGNGIIDVPYIVYAENGTPMSSDKYPLVSIDTILPPDDFQVWSFEKGSAYLTWKPRMSSIFDLIDGYRIYRGNDTVDMEPIIELDPYERTHWYTDSYEDRGLIHNISYSYYLVAFKGEIESPPTKTWSIIPDGDPGFISVISPVDDKIHTNTQITVSWIVEKSAPYDIDIDLRLKKGYHSIENWYNLDVNESPLLITNLSEGRYTLTFIVPGPDHSQEYDLSVVFYIDTAPPNITNIYPEEGSIVGGKYFNANWYVKDEGSGIAITRVKLDGGDYLDPAEQNKSNSWRFENIESGPHTITVLAVDNAGRLTTRTSNFTVDLTPCIFEFTGPAIDSLVNTREVEVGWIEFGNWSDFQRMTVKVKEYRGGTSYRSLDFDLDAENRTIWIENDRDRTVSVFIKTYDTFDNTYEDYLNFTIDTLRPEVKMITENEDLGLFGSIGFEFTELVNRTSIEFSLEEEGFNLIWENNSVFLVHDGPMDPGRTYFISFTGSDLAGNSLEENEFNFTVTDKGLLKTFLLNNETGFRINAHIYLNRTDGSENIYQYFSSFVDPLSMGEWHLLISKDGYHSYETTFTILPDETLDLGNITLYSIPGHDPGPGPIDDDDDDGPVDDDTDDDDGAEEKEGEEEVPYSLILIILLIILGLLLIVTLARKGRYKELENSMDSPFVGDLEE